MTLATDQLKLAKDVHFVPGPDVSIVLGGVHAIPEAAHKGEVLDRTEVAQREDQADHRLPNQALVLDNQTSRGHIGGFERRRKESVDVGLFRASSRNCGICKSFC